MAARGKWAQGIKPRNFAWIIKDKLAVSERPGGYGSNHRRVRRQEEIIWIRENGFSQVVSLIASPHNLHNYDELGVRWLHRPMSTIDPSSMMSSFYPELRSGLAGEGKMLLHAEELNDNVCGLVAGYLVWMGLVPAGPRSVSLIEQITTRQLGPKGRAIVARASEIEPA